MIEERFSAADLEPSDGEKRETRRSLVDRIAATVAVLAAGIWAGGMIALGVCAAPFVFRLTPAPFSGDAMGAAFSRFDQVAIGASVLLLGAEVARTWAAGARSKSVAARIRRLIAITMAALAAYGGLRLTPAIVALHHEGVQRGRGAQGEELERIHRRAEAVGKANVALAFAVIALHVFTLGARRPEEDDDYAAPLPPGPA